MKPITWMCSGGRISGLFPAPGLNVLWSNPRFEPGPGWPNPGGDRVWISPESELFFPDRERGWAAYTVPASIDPGNYSARETPEGVVMTNAGEAEFFGAGIRFPFRLKQEIRRLDDPGEEMPEGVSFAGYRKHVTLEVSGTFPEGLRPAIWNLAQFAPGSVLSVPGRRFRRYFGEPGCQIGEDGLEMPLPARGQSFKIGIEGGASSGRMFCTNFCAPRPWFVMRLFHPAAECCDRPWGGGAACCQQIFCDNGDAGGFGELEHHSEPVPCSGGVTEDVSRTMAFAGPLEKLEKLYRKFLQKGMKS